MQLVLLGTFTLSFMTWRVGSVQVSDGIFLCAAVVIVFKLLAGADADLAPAHARRGTVLVLVGSLLLSFAFLQHAGSWAASFLGVLLSMLFVQLFSTCAVLIGQTAGERSGAVWRKAALASARATRSCGRRGPAIDGTTVDRSSSRYSE